MGKIYLHKDMEFYNMEEMDMKEFEEAEELSKKGKNEEAEKIYLKLLKKYPNDKFILHNLGIIYYKLKKYEEAVKIWKFLIEREPNNALFNESLGITYKSIKNLDGALYFLKKAYKLEKSASVCLNLSLVYETLKDYNNALKLVEEAFRRNRDKEYKTKIERIRKRILKISKKRKV